MNSDEGGGKNESSRLKIPQRNEDVTQFQDNLSVTEDIARNMNAYFESIQDIHLVPQPSSKDFDPSATHSKTIYNDMPTTAKFESLKFLNPSSFKMFKNGSEEGRKEVYNQVLNVHYKNCETRIEDIYHKYMNRRFSKNRYANYFNGDKVAEVKKHIHKRLLERDLVYRELTNPSILNRAATIGKLTRKSEVISEDQQTFQSDYIKKLEETVPILRSKERQQLINQLLNIIEGNTES